MSAKNKVEHKKYLKITGIVIVFFTILSVLLCLWEYHNYTLNYNEKLYYILNVLKEKYPELTEQEMINILNAKENNIKDNFLNKYGIELNKDSIIQENNTMFLIAILLSILFTIILSIVLISLYLTYNKKKDRDIKEIYKYIKEINNGNYELTIDNNTEDELSILKNEVYKTMINLKESKEILLKEKITLKDSLSDISHQLKTPLTSIMISLDNLEDNLDIDIATREQFIKKAKRDTNNINFLIQALLKLSKFDANVVEFTKKEVPINLIINAAMLNVDNLCDLKNIKVNIIGNGKGKIFCDLQWQIEAITNVLKNAIEHCKNKVEISIEENNVYHKLSITNDGDEISTEDLKHIFDRFYKGTNAKKDSIGIGLSLSQKIIEKDNGYISAESNNKQTSFHIKYYK